MKITAYHPTKRLSFAQLERGKLYKVVEGTQEYIGSLCCKIRGGSNQCVYELLLFSINFGTDGYTDTFVPYDSYRFVLCESGTTLTLEQK